MKKYYSLAVGFLLMTAGFMLSCSKKDEYMNKAIITGYDLRTCACCGGLMITFSENSNPYAADYKLLQNDPASMGISEASKFPIYIELDWEPVSSCNGMWIKATRYKK